MEYEKFEEKIVSYILKDKKKCIDFISDNQKFVNNYLKYSEKPIYIQRLVNKINDTIVEKNLKKFKLVEKVLRHELFSDVLSEFRKSDVLIRAIKNEKTDAVKWLLTMDMDYYTQDENGVTALMQAVNNSSFLFVVKEILNETEDIVNIADNNGNTALFYSKDEKSFSLLCEKNPDFDHVNKDGDTLLIKCCKRKSCPNFTKIINRINDFDHVNERGKTAAMYLVEHGNYKELQSLGKLKVNLNYKNKNNETTVTILINKFKEIYNSKYFSIMKNYVYTMFILLTYDCDFNVTIDKEGNTPIMYFIMIGDYFATTLLLEKFKNLDLSIKNEHGINASYLYFSIDYRETILKEKIFNHKTFDCDFVDNDGNTMIMHFLVREKVKDELESVFKRKKVKTNEVNNKNENALMIATKLGLLPKCEYLFKTNNVNQQDYLGNTALYYAIKLKDKQSINLLTYYKADPTIKNYQGVSAFDLANELKEDFIFEVLKNPISPENMKEIIKKDEKPTIFGKKKTKEEKLDKRLENYVMNYQINNYKEEYQYLIKNKRRSYSFINVDKMFLIPCFIETYVYLYMTNAPNSLREERIYERNYPLEDVLLINEGAYEIKMYYEMTTTI
ncbi:ankyrin [Anaeromyces robustus]|uniref:Ankyrin n=1 Tax=Anaeromyces robustus TaxID=1754192 RepID=A0A1Y1UL26_9FUNG|nr:ankyrin [Anaeromyces robustus]ORX80232.1 ankyrin [Anaeromyces robustus]|eukprot:ORX38763.1 ankyrin [Anaeromyces robustus]